MEFDLLDSIKQNYARRIIQVYGVIHDVFDYSLKGKVTYKIHDVRTGESTCSFFNSEEYINTWVFKVTIVDQVIQFTNAQLVEKENELIKQGEIDSVERREILYKAVERVIAESFENCLCHS